MRLGGRVWSTFLHLAVPGLFAALWMLGLLLLIVFFGATDSPIPFGILFLLAVIVPAMIIVLLTERGRRR